MQELKKLIIFLTKHVFNTLDALLFFSDQITCSSKAEMFTNFSLFYYDIILIIILPRFIGSFVFILQIILVCF